MNTEELRVLSTEIAKELGFTIDESENSDVVKLLSGDEFCTGISLRINEYRHPGRIIIASIFGFRLHDFVIYCDKDWQWPEITVSDTQPTDKIIAAIKRRLMPDHITSVAAAVQRLQDHIDYKKHVTAIAQRCKDASGGVVELKAPDPNSRETDWVIYGNSTVHLHAFVSGNGVRFQNLYLSPEQAERVFRALYQQGEVK